MRIALIFDDRLRPETTGVYCRRALAAMAGTTVEFFHPEDMPWVPRQGFDLYLFIDDGLDYPLPDDLRPSAFWAIDTHLDYQRAVARARNRELVFAAQRNGAERLGIGSAQWLPLACDPEVHRPWRGEEERGDAETR